jgi:hypothetical protein
MYVPHNSAARLIDSFEQFEDALHAAPGIITTNHVLTIDWLRQHADGARTHDNLRRV